MTGCVEQAARRAKIRRWGEGAVDLEDRVERASYFLNHISYVVGELRPDLAELYGLVHGVDLRVALNELHSALIAEYPEWTLSEEDINGNE